LPPAGPTAPYRDIGLVHRLEVAYNRAVRSD